WRQLIDDLPMRKVRVILCGRDLSSRDLESIRPEIESFGAIEATSDDTRDLIAREGPHLVPRLHPPAKYPLSLSDGKLLRALWIDLEFLRTLRNGRREVDDAVARSRVAVRESMGLLALADAMARPLISETPSTRE